MLCIFIFKQKARKVRDGKHYIINNFSNKCPTCEFKAKRNFLIPNFNNLVLKLEQVPLEFCNDLNFRCLEQVRQSK